MNVLMLLSATTNPSDNDANVFVFGFLLLLVVSLLGYIIYALKKGIVVAPGDYVIREKRYSRQANPFFYWSYIIMYLGLAGGLLYPAYELYQQGFGTFFR